MSTEKKIVKGGFRATLALIVSIIALIVAIIAFNRTGGEADLRAQVSDLQARMKVLRTETSEKVNKVRQETTKALKKVGIEIKKEGVKKEEAEKEQIKEEESGD
jgi:YbbR domain-containing protein